MGTVEGELQNYLSLLTSHNNVPLSYAIRKAIDANYKYKTKEEEQIYSVTFQGEGYLRDRKRIFQLLKGFLVGTNGNTWLGDYKGATDGRMAYRALCSARQTLQDAHYQSKQSYPIECFITKLKKAYTILEDNGKPKHKLEKVREVCKQIYTNNQELVAACRATRTNPTYRNNFVAAANHLSKVVLMIFPAEATCRFVRRNISSMDSGPKNFYRGRGRGRGWGCGFQGGRGSQGGRFSGNKRDMCNGVDISDLTRFYPGHELDRLPQSIKTMIWNAKGQKKQRTEEENHRKIAAMVTANLQGQNQQTNQQADNTDRKTKGGKNGSAFGSGAYHN